MNIFIFILLLILLILSAILIALSSKSNFISVKKGGIINTNQIDAAQLYEMLNNMDTNVAITIFKSNTGKISIEFAKAVKAAKDAKVAALIYGKDEALISNIDILLHILLHIDDYLRIICIGDMIAFKCGNSKNKLLSLLKKHLPKHLKEIKMNNGVHILTFDQKLDFDPIENSIATLIKKMTGTTSSSNSIYRLMEIFTEKKIASISKKGGEELYEINLSPHFLSEFEQEIKIKYNSSVKYDNIQEESPSLYTRFMYTLVENNRNVKIVSEIPHTEKMKKGTIYFLPKKGTSSDISVFSKLGINNYTNIPLGEYYINNSQNVIKIE